MCVVRLCLRVRPVPGVIVFACAKTNNSRVSIFCPDSTIVTIREQPHGLRYCAGRHHGVTLQCTHNELQCNLWMMLCGYILANGMKPPFAGQIVVCRNHWTFCVSHMGVVVT